ncbi:LysM peptidoglycan-binding domain-containing protein [Glycomyces sp. L485]|uniref:LysM peptidoglycan-binding domain-containing protein n=1 Tax=Glycomyces sp. L485 TaxID=2909235 RepID=UPI001F4AEAA3|nr:LysM peptidoglycan-binding domain-containing protein [Glycomyces sp. L485]MCH7229935.1 LysM peptidoglycan-binding domain-containing protein [Glycomyces sp. L485]
MRTLKAAAALMAIAVLIIGPPLLLTAAGWPLPDHVPSLEEFWATAARPPSDRLVLNAVVLLGWVLWVALLRAFAVELWRQVRHARWGTASATPVGRGPLRWVAAVLVAAVVSAGPAAAAVPAGAEAESITVAAPIDPAAEHTEADERSGIHAQQNDAEQVVHVVERGDTLWDIAADDDYLDDPRRYPEIFEANEGVTQDDGRALEDEDLIYPGWELTIPIVETDTEEESEPTTPPQTEDPESEAPESEPETGDPASPSTGPSGDETEASPSPSADSTSPLPEEDGVVPAPSTTGPTETPEPDSESEAAAQQTNAADTASTAAEHTGTGTLPTGLWLTAGTFLALGTGFSLLVFLRRRRAQAGPPADEGRTLTGRLADLDALLEDDEAPPDPVLPLAVNKDRRDAPEASLLDWAHDGLGLDGPGAHAVARAAIITAATSEVPVVVTASTAEYIGLDPAHTPAHLTVVADIDAALDAAEERIEDPVFDLSAGRIDLPPLLLIAEDPHDREQRLTEILEHDLIGALVLGDWKPAQLTIAADGTVTAYHPPEAGLDRLERCYIADPSTLNEAMKVTIEPAPAPIPDPEPGDEDDGPQEQPEAEESEPAPIEDTPTTDAKPRLILLGAPALTWQGRPVQWRRRRSLALLAALAAAPDGLTRDDLLETVVGDSHVDKARGHLGTIASDTRRDVRDTTGLDIRAILHDDQTDRYRLHPDITSDLADFRRQRHLAATSTTDAERRDHLTRALACYGGDFATGLDDDWLEQPRTELRAAAYTTCLHLAALHRDADDLDAATAVLERATATAIDRTRPDAWTALIDTRTTAGDEVGAQKARRGQRLWTTGDHNTTPM